jgi:hypothetical protein
VRVAVSLFGCGMGVGCDSAIQMWDGHGAAVPLCGGGLGAVPPCGAGGMVLDAGAGWEQDGARGMRCRHGTRELRLDAGLGAGRPNASLTIKKSINQPWRYTDTVLVVYQYRIDIHAILKKNVILVFFEV